MKIYKTVFQRPSVAVAFPSMIDGELAAHIQETYTQCDPVRLVAMTSEIAPDLLSLIVSRTFATEADAVAFSQDPQFVAYQEAQLAGLAAAGITRESVLLDPEA
jgi:hypothetical protein